MTDRERLNALQQVVLDLTEIIERQSNSMLRICDALHKLLDKLGAPPATTKEKNNDEPNGK